MRDEILTNISPLNADNPGSLPSIINLSQYRSRSPIPLYATGSKKETVVGSLETGEFDFQIVAGDDDIVGKRYEQAVAGFDKENPKGNPNNNSNITKILRSSLFDRYIIFEVPDYGQLSMSTYYRDFVPHVYLNGYKVWQKYISIIKYYTAKKAYILVMKENNLNVLDLSNTIIRICYKNAKEDYDLLATHYCKKENKDINKLTGNPYTLHSTSFIFDGKLNGDIISDYDYFYKITNDDNTEKYIQINPELIDNIELKDRKASRTLYSQKNYFRQVAGIDVSTDKPNFYNSDIWNSTDFEREVSVKIEISLKTEIIVDGKEIEGIYLKSKYNNLKVEYTDKEKKYDVNYEMFNKAGERIEENTADNEVELIPEYSSKRKIVLRNLKENDTEQSPAITVKEIFGYYMPIYRSNLDNGEILVYDSNGLFKGNIKEKYKDEITAKSTLIIYDNNEKEDKTVISTGNETNFDINRNSDNLNGIEIKSNDEGITDIKEYASDKPISTFLLKLNNILAPKAYIICRCFPVPLDYYYVAKDLVYYKLPDYFYAPKNLYNRTENFGEYEKEKGDHLNKFILDSIESVIYFDSNVSGCTFYDINNLNSIIYDENNKNTDKDETLGNCHIINYNKRYIKPKKVIN